MRRPIVAVKEFGWALEGEETLRREIQPEVQDLLASLDSKAEDPLGEEYKLSEQDAAVLEREDLRAMLGREAAHDQLAPRPDLHEPFVKELRERVAHRRA